MATTFRLAKPAHLEQLVECLGTGATNPPALRSRLAWLLDDPGRGMVWLIERAGRSIGGAVLEFGEGDQRPRFAYLTGLWLEPACREQGIGELALRLVRSIARNLDWKIAIHEDHLVMLERKLPTGVAVAEAPEPAMAGVSLTATGTMRAA